MIVALLYKMQTPYNCFTLSLSGSDSRRSNSVTSQIFNLECYTLDHHAYHIFLLLVLILEILRNSRTHGESWGFRYFHI